MYYLYVLEVKYNEATELGVTNGQKANVVEWIARTDPDDGRKYLDTLFVWLDSPLKNIQLKDLPLNVVPLTSKPIQTKVQFPDGKTVSISRTQVQAVLNFGMTDYNSQGRTLKHNIVNPTNLRDHRSIYTALSRGVSAQGTVLLDKIPKQKVQGQINGELRQEFRELELLNYITELRYESALDKTVTGLTRNELIYNFRNWKGESFIPPDMSIPLKHTKSQSTINIKPANELTWSIVNESNQIVALPSAGIIPAVGSNPLKRGLDNHQTSSPNKKSRILEFTTN